MLLHFQFKVPVRAAWLLQELPSFVIPVYTLLVGLENGNTGGNLNSLVVCLFALHYFHRSLVYSIGILTDLTTVRLPGSTPLR